MFTLDLRTINLWERIRHCHEQSQPNLKLTHGNQLIYQSDVL